MPFGNKQRLGLLVLSVLLLLRLSPMSVYNASLLLLGNSCGWAWQTVRAVPAPLPPLKAAILNVTSDFDQLAHLIGDFMQQPAVDPQVEVQFKEYLAQRATKSYPRLESLLDWLLAVYKFLFPFLLISMAAKRSGGGKDQAAEEDEAYCDAAPQMEPAQPSVPSFTRHSSLQQNGPVLAGRHTSAARPGGSQAQHHPRRMAASSDGGSSSYFSDAPLTNGSIAAPRAGSQSPKGPETPVEGTGGRLPQHAAGWYSAATKPQRHRQRLATANEIDGEGF